jgi:hypothetical protein
MRLVNTNKNKQQTGLEQFLSGQFFASIMA